MAAMAATPCAAQHVAIVLGEAAAAYGEVADAIKNSLGSAAKVSVRSTAALAQAELDQANLIVAVGARAATRLAALPGRAPLLVTLMPREGFDRLAAAGSEGGARPMSAIHLDQPLGRQMALVRLALPEARRIGVLLGPATAPKYDALAAAAQEHGLRLEARQVLRPGDLAPALLGLLPEIDLLLALPDPAVFNGETIQMILLSAYRHQRPLVGFSASYTRAGAVISLYSTPEQIGTQAADMLRAALANGRLPPPRYAREYRISVNPHVAHTLGLRLDSEQTLRQRLHDRE